MTSLGDLIAACRDSNAQLCDAELALTRVKLLRNTYALAAVEQDQVDAAAAALRVTPSKLRQMADAARLRPKI